MTLDVSSLVSNKEVEILRKLRSRNIDVKSNFKNQFTDKNNIMHLECSMDGCNETEDQEHLLSCIALINRLGYKPKKNVKFTDIFSNNRKEKKIVHEFAALLEIKSAILEAQ